MISIKVLYNIFIMKRTLKKTIKLVSIFVSIFVVSFSSPVFAKLDSKTLNFFNQNNILYYDPTAGGCEPAEIDGNKVTIIGDSISVGAESEYVAQIPSADFASKTYDGTTYNLTEVSKHFAVNAGTNYSGMTIAEVVQEQGDMRPYLVFALGTNDPGAVTESSIESLMNLVGENHKVVLVTNYALENHLDYSVNNTAIRAAAETYDNVAVADWAEEVDKNPTAYIEDTAYYVHPNANGSRLFVKLIKEALDSLSASGSGSILSTGDNRNYAGETVWSDAEMQAIEENKAIYQEAAEHNGFPWQVMAVLHSQETGLRRYNPWNGQGVYQLYSYTDGGTNANRFEPADEISEAEFRRQTEIAASIVKDMAGDLNNPDNVKRLFFQYNGVAQVYIQKALNMGFTEEEARNGEGSSYVMNRYDAKRDPASSQMSPYWPGRFVADGVYDPNGTSMGFGAFVKYTAIGGGGNGTCSEGGLRSGGMTLEEANEFMHEYTQVDYRTWDVNDAGCSGGPLANCVAFSQYFINRYTSAHFSHLTNGSGVVALLLASGQGFIDGGTTPRAYAIFSVPSGSMYCGAVKCGHTGVVLGIDTANDKIIIGEAGCSTSLSWADYAHEYSLSAWTDTTYTYAYTDDILNLRGN